MGDYPDRPGYSFDPGPPPEVSRYLKNKGLRPSFSWLDVEPEEHAVAFAVAKMGEIDLLEAARAEVQRVVNEALPFEAFKKNWRDRPALAQWLGKREYTDPLTGEMVEIKRSPARRLKVIYEANLRSARAAGQWERIERTQAAFPYLEYRLGPSEQHRPLHVEKAGMIIAVDSPFWDDWMPPNGWGCKCWVRQVTRREAERRGITATPEIPDRIVQNERTGEMAIVPVGIDPGWQRNPGKLRRQAMETVLAGKLRALPDAVARAALRDIATSWRVTRIMDGAPGRAPVGILSEAMASAASVEDPLVWVNAATFEHVVRDHMDAPKEVDFRKALMAVVANVGEAKVASVEVRDDGKRTLRVLIPFTADFHIAESLSPEKAARPTALILWFDDGMRVRTIFPSSEERFRKDAIRRADKIIELD